MANKLPKLWFANRHDFGHLELQQVNRYVRL